MKNAKTLAALLSLAFAGGAFAQAPAQPAQEQVIQRQVNQQQRVENGLKDGSLTTREAGQIEKKESGLDRMIARDSKDGISAKEQKQINARENAISRDIARDTHNARRGNPASASSQRMQADVQRNVNQDKRIEAGVQSGQLSGQEVAQRERGQSHVDAKEARAARNGHVSAAEQAGVQRSENRQSRRIHRDRHDAS